VLMIIHRQEYVITVPEEEISRALFERGREETVKIVVSRILRPPRAVFKRGEISDFRTLMVGHQCPHVIHAGYQRVLLGLIREIEFFSVDKIEDLTCKFRAHYLVKILDAFADELQNPGDKEDILTKTPHLFRSQVLNPILQRQRLGVYDNEPNDVKKAVGAKVDDAYIFYLSADPLHSKWANLTLRNILYISSVRLSLIFFSSECHSQGWNNAHHNTKIMLTKRRLMEEQGSWVDSILDDVEIETISRERLRPLYDKLIKSSVRSGVLSSLLIVISHF
jgi:hypothetical protein